MTLFRTARSPWPVYGAFLLALGAFVTAWPEPIGPGWGRPTLIAVLAGMGLSPLWWRGAAEEARAERKAPVGAMIGVTVCAGFTAAIILHLANFALPPGGPQQAIVTVTDKYVSTGRRGRKSYHVVTTSPFAGEMEETHRVGGFFNSQGRYEDFTVGGCMQIGWRRGWFGWAVVTDRVAVPCPRKGSGPG